MPMLRRCIRISAYESLSRSTPLNTISPPFGSTSRLTQRISVDLPEPLGPMMAKKSSAPSVKLMPLRISRSP